MLSEESGNSADGDSSPALAASGKWFRGFEFMLWQSKKAEVGWSPKQERHQLRNMCTCGDPEDNNHDRECALIQNPIVDEVDDLRTASQVRAEFDRELAWSIEHMKIRTKKRQAAAKARGEDYITANPTSFDSVKPFQRQDMIAVSKEDVDIWTKISRRIRQMYQQREKRISYITGQLEALREQEAATEARRKQLHERHLIRQHEIGELKFHLAKTKAMTFMQGLKRDVFSTNKGAQGQVWLTDLRKTLQSVRARAPALEAIKGLPGAAGMTTKEMIQEILDGLGSGETMSWAEIEELVNDATMSSVGHDEHYHAFIADGLRKGRFLGGGGGRGSKPGNGKGPGRGPGFGGQGPGGKGMGAIMSGIMDALQKVGGGSGENIDLSKIDPDAIKALLTSETFLSGSGVGRDALLPVVAFVLNRVQELRRKGETGGDKTMSMNDMQSMVASWLSEMPSLAGPPSFLDSDAGGLNDLSSEELQRRVLKLLADLEAKNADGEQLDKEKSKLDKESEEGSAKVKELEALKDKLSKQNEFEIDESKIKVDPIPGIPAPGAPQMAMGNGPGPPPPPPPPGIGGPPPPPGSGPAGLNLPERKTHALKPGVKMKLVNWKKIPNFKVQNTFWADDAKELELDEFFGELEELFAAAKPVETNKETKPKVIQVIDPQKGNNLGIVLRGAKLDDKDISKALLSMDSQIIPEELLDALTKYVPTQDELMAIQKVPEGDLSRLGGAEQFLLHMSNIPRYAERLRVMKFVNEFEERLADLVNGATALKEALQAMRKSEKVRSMLELVLALGNYLNAGTARGGVYGFSIDTLLKLSDTRTRDNKSNLLGYMVHLMDEHEKFSNARDFFETLGPVKEAARASESELREAFTSLRTGVVDLSREIQIMEQRKAHMEKESEGKAEENSSVEEEDRFIEVIEPFNESATEKITEAASLMSEITDAYTDVVKYFGQDPKVVGSADVLCQTMCDFHAAIIHAREENERRKQADIRKMKSAERVAALKKNDGRPQTAPELSSNENVEEFHDPAFGCQHTQTPIEKPIEEEEEGGFFVYVGDQRESGDEGDDDNHDSYL